MCSKDKQIGSVLNICQSSIFHKPLSLMENHLKPSIAPEIPLKNSDFRWSNKGFKYLGITVYPKVDNFFYSSSKILLNTFQQS